MKCFPWVFPFICVRHRTPGVSETPAHRQCAQNSRSLGRIQDYPGLERKTGSSQSKQGPSSLCLNIVWASVTLHTSLPPDVSFVMRFPSVSLHRDCLLIQQIHDSVLSFCTSELSKGTREIIWIDTFLLPCTSWSVLSVFVFFFPSFVSFRKGGRRARDILPWSRTGVLVFTWVWIGLFKLN